MSSSSSSRSHISASRQSVGATLTTFVTCLRTLLRNPEFMVWTLAFPLIMSTIFLVMFSNLKTTKTIEAVPVAVVVDNAWSDSQFSHVVSELSHASVTDTSSIADSNTSPTALLAPTDVAHVEEGQELLTNGSVAGVFSVDAEGTPHLITTKMDAGSGYTPRERPMSPYLRQSRARMFKQRYLPTTSFKTILSWQRRQALSQKRFLFAAMSIPSRSLTPCLMKPCVITMPCLP